MSNTIYYHKHHIIPKSLGGTNHPNNIVKLTITGHIAIHKWMYEEYGRWQDKLAWETLSGRIDKEQAIRIACYNANKGRKLTEEHKRKLSIAGKSRKVSEETRKRMSKAQKGLKKSEKHKEKLRQSNLGKKLTEETKIKIGIKSGIGMRGKKHTDEAKRKMSESSKGKKMKIVICPYCDKEGGIQNMKRYHFDNCKKYEKKY